MTSTAPAPPAEQWSIVELMGRRVVAGLVSEVQQFGRRHVQVDIPNPAGGSRRQLYNPQGVFCVTPCSESAARLFAAQGFAGFPDGLHPAAALRHAEPELDTIDITDGTGEVVARVDTSRPAPGPCQR